MNQEEMAGYWKGEKHRGGGHKRRDRHGAQTFRRGRALDFLERLQLKRMTLKQQLEAPEFLEIKPIILGELKAIEMVIDEFVQQFELYEVEELKKPVGLGEGEEEVSSEPNTDPE
ncbi:hypothetical protein [Neobacillus muris]|uniref:hypothetical protein n=1 Tax=Neobacillus muris TaxID=2941334 RepID=UPI0020424AFD|nr:hypothetical protein [Neobacillus muris]